MPTVSVILPTHNRAVLLKEAVESVLAQTFIDWELIVIDDGSTDETPQVVHTFAARDARIRGIRQEKQGVSAARNAGITIAQGSYIAFLDSDDVWFPEKLSIQVKMLDEHPEVGLISGTMQVIDEQRKIVAIKPKIWQEERTDLFRRGSWVTSSVMIRRTCLEGMPWFDTRLSILEDHDLYVRLCRQSRELFLKEPVGLYRQHSANTVADQLKVNEGQVTYWTKVVQEYELSMEEKRYAKGMLARSFYLLGKAQYARGQYGASVRLLFAALRHDPMLGRHFIEAGDPLGVRLWKRLKPWLVIGPAAVRALVMPTVAPSAAAAPTLKTILYVETGSGYGGSAQCLHALLTRLDLQRFRPVVVAYGEGTAIREIRALGILVRVVRYRTPRTGGYLRRAWMWGTQELPLALWLSHFMKEEDVSLVHVNNDLYSAVTPLLAAKLAGRPVVCHIRIIRTPTRIERWLGTLADAIVVITKNAFEFYKRTWPAGRLEMIYDAISPSFAATPSAGVRQTLNVPASAPLIGLIARCVPGKGYEEFLHAAAIVRQRVPSARFLIVGNGAGGDAGHEAAMHHLAEQIGLNGSVIWAGWREDVSSVLRELDVVVQASSTFPEGFGRVLLEAMVNERPIVATSIPSSTEVLGEGEAGLLVPPGDANALAHGIVTLLEHPELANALISAGKQRVHQLFGLEAHVKRIEALYDDILKPA